MFQQTDAPTFYEAVSAACQQTKNGRRVGETVALYDPAEYAEMRCFLNRSGLTGYAIKPDGDLVSVFNVGDKGAGQDAVRDAILNGALMLDAYDEGGYLPALYAKLGFVEAWRDTWEPAYAPEGWTGGTPDVVYMVLGLAVKVDEVFISASYRRGNTTDA